MSGHSHWAGIKHKKAAEDAKRGRVFSKLARIITLTAKEGGGDPATNPKLKDAMEYARSFNLPKENIERAIKRGTGEIAGAALLPYTLEAFAPGGVPTLIETITDNKNRTLAEIKTILARHNGKLAGEGNVRWRFTQRGALELKIQSEKLKNRDELELGMIEAGADDIKWGDEIVKIYVPPENIAQAKTHLQNKGFEIESSNIEWVPKEEVEPDEKTRKTLEKLFEDLDELDDVQTIYSNLRG